MEQTVTNDVLEEMYPRLDEYPSEYGNLIFVKSTDRIYLSQRDIEYLQNGKLIIIKSDEQEICIKKKTT